LLLPGALHYQEVEVSGFSQRARECLWEHVQACTDLGNRPALVRWLYFLLNNGGNGTAGFRVKGFELVSVTQVRFKVQSSNGHARRGAGPKMSPGPLLLLPAGPTRRCREGAGEVKGR